MLMDLVGYGLMYPDKVQKALSENHKISDIKRDAESFCNYLNNLDGFDKNVISNLTELISETREAKVSEKYMRKVYSLFPNVDVEGTTKTHRVIHKISKHFGIEVELKIFGNWADSLFDLTK